MKEIKLESLFIVGIFAAGLVVGYLVGDRRTVIESPMPVNYDPVRALCADMLKVERERAEVCWQSAINALRRSP